MTRYLLGFDDDVSLYVDEEILGDVGYHWWDYALAVPTGGSSFVFSAGQNEYQKSLDSGPAKYTFSASDPTKYAAYQQAAANLAAAQARQGAQAPPSSSVIPINVGPSGVTPLQSLAPLNFSIPGLPSLATVDLSQQQQQAVTGALMSARKNAVLGAEYTARKHGHHASIDQAGCTSCAKCGTPLHCRIDGGPTADPGAPVGTATVVGEDSPVAPASSQLLKAATPGSCLCCCPKCGAPLCLTLTEDGYDERLATYAGARYATGGHNQVVGSRVMQLPQSIQVFGYFPSGRPVLGTTRGSKVAPPKPSPHKAAIKKSGNAVAAAAKAGALATARAKQYNPANHKPLVAVTGIGWGDEEIIGIAPYIDTIVVMGHTLGVGTNKPLTPHQKAAVQRHANAVVKTANSFKKAADAGAKATKAAADLDAYRKKAAPAIARFINRASPSAGQLRAAPAGHQQVLGSTITVFGLDSAGRAPGQDGYDPSTEDGTGAGGGVTQGSYPALQTPYTSADPNAAGGDPNCVPLPVRGDGTLSKDDAQVTWHKVPDDACRYDGSLGLPSDSLCSWGICYNGSWINDQSGDGFYWHANPGEDAKWWAIRHGHGDAQHAGDTIAESSAQFGWGPLVGNPNGPLKGLQWALDDKVWFWQASVAPSQFTVEADTALVNLNNKTLAADNAAINANNSRIQAEMDSDAEAKAKQDAANALATSASDAQSNIDAARQQTQATAIDLQQAQYDQQAAAQKAAADLQAQVQAQALTQQSTQADIQAAIQQQAIQLEYLKAHPELTMQDQSQQSQVGPSYSIDDLDAGVSPDDSFWDDANTTDDLADVDMAEGY